ncbi:MAG: D-alanine--D-alanine ligase [Lachnospiraceae bacterium]|nr:D-alanine--D-alanine ligase [Lachnospiraceae bacterium]
MNIVVLAGGLSTERDVSIKTGEMVAKALKENGHKVILLDVFMGYSDKEEDMTNAFDRADEISLKPKNIPEVAPDLEKVKAQRADKSDCFFGPNVIELCRMSDVVFMALHGENGENGKIQATFDLFGIRYTGTGYFGSAISMDKYAAKIFITDAGVPMAHSVKVKKCDVDKGINELGVHIPCVVKPVCGGSSIGVSIAHDEKSFRDALRECYKWEDEALVEDYVEGREFSVGVMEGKALPIIEIAPVTGFYDYKNKYKAGSAVETCPAEISEELTKEMQGYAERVAKVLGLDTYSRIDFLMNEKNEMFCLEANTLPGMTPTSLLPQEAKVVGVDFGGLCEKIIEISLKKR